MGSPGPDLTDLGFRKYGKWPVNDRAAGVTNDPTSPPGCWSRWNGDGFDSGATLISPGRVNGEDWRTNELNKLAFNTIMPPNGPTCTAEFKGGIWTAKSRHEGGVNVVMLDGAVKFIASTIESGSRTAEKQFVDSGPSPYGVWGALGTRASGEAGIGGDL